MLITRRHLLTLLNQQFYTETTHLADLQGHSLSQLVGGGAGVRYQAKHSRYIEKGNPAGQARLKSTCVCIKLLVLSQANSKKKYCNS